MTTRVIKGSSWFKFMDLILGVSGLNVYHLPGKLCCIEWVLRILSVLYTHLLLLHSILTYINRMDDPYSLLFLMQLFFGVVSFQSIIRSRRKITLIVEEVVGCNNTRLLNDLFKGSQVLFLLWAIVVIVQYALLSLQWYFIGTIKWMHQYLIPVKEYDTPTIFHHLLVSCDITFWVFFVIGFAVGTICCFLYILFCLNKLYMFRMKSLAEKLDYTQSLAKNLECFREIRAKYQVSLFEYKSCIN